MDIGLLTARFKPDKDLAEIARWASGAGFGALEVATQHLDPQSVLKDDGIAVKKLLNETGLRISSLAHYKCHNKGTTAEVYTRELEETFQAAEVLGVDVVCTLAGFPEENKTKQKSIREDLPAIFGPLAEKAEKRGVKIAFENWYATNLQNLAHFEALTKALPHPNIGFNFDPSHLYWQQIDYLAAVEAFKDRIFHVHAKDVATRQDKLARLGVLENGWWRYVIPGFGEISWGRFLLALKEIGYKGAVSIEHEDSAFTAEKGFASGRKHLATFL